MGAYDPMVRVKICGIRRLEDALVAVGHGADALGFLVGQLHSSPDFISPEAARSIIGKLPPFCTPVLVTHLEKPKGIIDIARTTGCTTVQLQGDVTVKDVDKIRRELPSLKVYKAVHVEGPGVLDTLNQWTNVDALLLDTAVWELDQVGGTGKTHDWNLSAQAVKVTKLPIILAGGLTPDNVEPAIRLVRPYAVDVNSGTKDPKGYKDPEKVKRFIDAARRRLL
jgi:phosphoribosylanthranilate isomerase